MRQPSEMPENSFISDRILANTKRIVQENQIRFQKKFGQNFLIDAHVLAKITAAADLHGDETVIEVGPGIGTLTQELAEGAEKVIAIEIDRHLAEVLKTTLAAYPNVTVLNQDVLGVDLQQVREMCADGPVKMVANLPYNITSPLVMKVLEEAPFVSELVLMVQEEVARRMQAQAGTKDYGSLSVAVQYYAQADIAAFVPLNCFYPRPKVGSCVIRLKRLDQPAVDVESEEIFFSVVRAAFNQRRKTLLNSLSNGLSERFSKDQIQKTLAAAGVDSARRGETLDTKEFAMIANILYNDYCSAQDTMEETT